MKRWIKHILFFCLVCLFAFISITYDAPELVSTHFVFSLYGVGMLLIHQFLLRLSGLDNTWTLVHAVLMFFLLLFMHTVYWHWWDFLLTAHTARAGLHHLVNFIKSPLPLFIIYTVFQLLKQTKVGYSSV